MGSKPQKHKIVKCFSFPARFVELVKLIILVKRKSRFPGKMTALYLKYDKTQNYEKLFFGTFCQRIF